MNILFPGRHHLLTQFQHDYLARIIKEGLITEKDVDGNPLGLEGKVDSVIFAVTSANHSNTRRNPVPYPQRAMALQEFSADLGVPAYIFEIDNLTPIPDFASYTLERVKHKSDGELALTPENTVVLCSTPVLEMYERLGFKILPAELLDRKTHHLSTKTPWQIVEAIAAEKGDWRKSPDYISLVHPASKRLWETYRLGDKVKIFFSDRMIGDDGDLTETRDYNSYVRGMDKNATLKYEETSPHIRPGRIGDIGCAVGSWIKLASEDPRFHESDFFGVEISRPLYEICEQRKLNCEFGTPYVFFSRKNAVSGLVFEPGSMNTIHTSSITHEIMSYGGMEALKAFIRNRYAEVTSGGIWVNRDVVGPENGDDEAYMWLNDSDGQNEDIFRDFEDRESLAKHIAGLSTFGKFMRFSRDFRRQEGYRLDFSIETAGDKKYAHLTLRDSSEFMTKKDYPDNWESEMHETFCFWALSDHVRSLREAGFNVLGATRAYPSQWIIEKRLKGKVALYTPGSLEELPFPDTHILIVGEK